MKKIVLKVFLSYTLLLPFIVTKAENSNNKDKTENKAAGSEMLIDYISQLYNSLEFNNEKPSFEIFKKGVVGYLNMKSEGKLSASNIITLVDFSLPSDKNRLWIIDLDEKKIVFNTLVAHGKNSGNVLAESFSNVSNSYQSSLGFYVTGEKYYGKHGLSMRLIGTDVGFNDNAYKRAIVLHGADYVSEDFIKKHGRLGRSLGCPAVPLEFTKEIVELTSNGTVLFIYKPDEKYDALNTFLNELTATEYLANELSTLVKLR